MAAQILAVIIFIVMFGLIIWDHIERHIVSLGCGLLTLVLVFGVCMHSEVAAAETLSLRSFMVPNFWFQTEAAAESSSGINWATILFIAGMMLMVEGMERAGFFRWLCLTIAKAVHYKTIPIFISFMLMSAFLAMFIDSITVILFLAAVTVELAHLLHFDPIPMIISEIFCSNLGGSATMCGDPPNIIIGTSLGYSFKDFILNTGMMAGVSLIFIVLFFQYTRIHTLFLGNTVQHPMIINRKFKMLCQRFRYLVSAAAKLSADRDDHSVFPLLHIKAPLKVSHIYTNHGNQDYQHRRRSCIPAIFPPADKMSVFRCH